MICFRNRCISLWLAFTIVWAVGVLAVVASRLDDQVAASRDLAADIAALDCPSTSPCAHDEGMVTRWSDLVMLVVEYRAPLLLEITLLPPLGALGIALFVLARRRRTQAAVQERSPRTALAHG
jgi:hypothetical protein